MYYSYFNWIIVKKVIIIKLFMSPDGASGNDIQSRKEKVGILFTSGILLVLALRFVGAKIETLSGGVQIGPLTEITVAVFTGIALGRYLGRSLRYQENLLSYFFLGAFVHFGALVFLSVEGSAVWITPILTFVIGSLHYTGAINENEEEVDGVFQRLAMISKFSGVGSEVALTIAGIKVYGVALISIVTKINVAISYGANNVTGG
jgi:hypothetical protein